MHSRQSGAPGLQAVDHGEDGHRCIQGNGAARIAPDHPCMDLTRASNIFLSGTPSGSLSCCQKTTIRWQSRFAFRPEAPAREREESCRREGPAVAELVLIRVYYLGMSSQEERTARICRRPSSRTVDTPLPGRCLCSRLSLCRFATFRLRTTSRRCHW